MNILYLTLNIFKIYSEQDNVEIYLISFSLSLFIELFLEKPYHLINKKKRGLEHGTN